MKSSLLSAIAILSLQSISAVDYTNALATGAIGVGFAMANTLAIKKLNPTKSIPTDDLIEVKKTSDEFSVSCGPFNVTFFEKEHKTNPKRMSFKTYLQNWKPQFCSIILPSVLAATLPIAGKQPLPYIETILPMVSSLLTLHLLRFIDYNFSSYTPGKNEKCIGAGLSAYYLYKQLRL